MSYDVHLLDPVTKEDAQVPGHLMIGGTFKADYHPETGTFTPALNTDAHLNITYNYGCYYKEVEKEGIRAIYGKDGCDSIKILENMIHFLENKYKVDDEWITGKRTKTVYYDRNGREVDDTDAIFGRKEYDREEEVEYEVSEGDTSNYWEATAANAIKPLYQLIALAKMRPDCVGDGD